MWVTLSFWVIIIEKRVCRKTCAMRLNARQTVHEKATTCVLEITTKGKHGKKKVWRKKGSIY